MDFIKKILQEIRRESDGQGGHYHSLHKRQRSVTYNGKPNQSREPLHENKEDKLVATPCFARLSRTSLSHIRASTNGHLKASGNISKLNNNLRILIPQGTSPLLIAQPIAAVKSPSTIKSKAEVAQPHKPQ
eukprot:TRINITY_DN11790_c2_g1_i1.p1 TRINITY_DN11790_c2_g1~~TRINITY_DN11790_c2_g1_i1.p1  ORF type:complete len:131 (+),score=11.77 TRINITY_DN11790_c2_g1_i1:645-1037(+)